MGLFGRRFNGGERTPNHEAKQQEPREDYPAFRGENKYESVRSKTEEERRAEICVARDAVKNAYKKPGESNYEALKMDFETVENKTINFFDSLQGLCEGMNLYYGGRFSWPKNNCGKFMDKFGGKEFGDQKNHEMHAKIAFAASLIDAEWERRKVDNNRVMDRDEKYKIFSSFHYPLYKVYVSPEIGGFAWEGFDKNKFEVANPSAGLGGTYEKFFGSDENPERRALAEKAIGLYGDLAPFMDKNSGVRTMNKFLAENRGKTIEGFRRREVNLEAKENEVFDLRELRNKRNKEVFKIEDEIEGLSRRGRDTFIVDRIKRLQGRIQELDDETSEIRTIEQTMGEANKIAVKRYLSDEISAQEQKYNLLTNNRNMYDKGSEKYKQNEIVRREARRRIKTLNRILEEDFR